MNIDKGLVIGVVFINLRKAFDTVDVNILLAKLPSFGITGMEHKWFKSYLSERYQSVSVDGHLSSPLPVSICVPQGSILGPLLFLLILNDLPTVTESCETNMYADDTEIDSASKPDCPEELENNINSDLCKISEYFNMLIGTYQSLAKMPETSIHINNEPLHKVTISKYTSMFIDSNLKGGMIILT